MVVGPIIWASRLQTLTAQLTTEAEFIFKTYCVREDAWIRDTLVELGLKQVNPTFMHQDNLGAIFWTNDVPGLRKVEHIGLRYHVVREAVKPRVICVV